MWTYSKILQALNLNADISDTPFENFPIQGFSIDTRSIKAGDVFVSLKGENQDGSIYLQDALDKGAAALILDQDTPADRIPSGSTFFTVPSTYKALEQLGVWSRSEAVDTRVVAVTGSAGKTTTKNWIASILKSIAPTVFAEASYNNHIGVPLSLTKLCTAEKPQYGVFEVGMNHVGEIAPLSHMIRPHACIITTIGAAHIGNLGSLEAIAAEKASILEGLEEGGVGIIPFDSPFQDILQARKGLSYITFGKEDGADIRLLSYTENGSSSSIEVDVFGKKYAYTLPFIGEHYVSNFLSVIGLLNHWNILNRLDPGLLKPSAQRGEIYELALDSGAVVRVFDDSYNANPASMAASLKVLASLNAEGKKVAVIGEMFELGEHSAIEHKKLAALLKNAGVDFLYAVGEGCLPLVKAWGKENCTYEPKFSNILPALKNALGPGDLLFIKGSNASRVGQVISLLQQKLAS